ncbi:Replication factor A protein 2 [Cladophialophora chaetospira]|uniref:Replication factor A protein 2 n=1 Tax=Cladophialophora chaetospira TaxID=386627 RepID=A0AA39CDM0_9EURO|nr:Replication factor A protein 2 [Cladophialophora chaetospira]
MAAVVEGVQTTSRKQKAEEIDGSSSALPPLNRSAKTIQLVAGADVTLKVGQREDVLDIKVSGAVLSVASKVFAAMLNSSFIEGITKVIELDQDDPQVVLHFCHIIHHQCDSIKGVDRKRLREISVLADMRGCEDAVRPWMMLAIDEHRSWAKATARDPTSLRSFPTSIIDLVPEDLMCIAYVFELPDLFWEASIAFVASSIPPLQEVDTFINIDTKAGDLFGIIRPIGSQMTRWLLEKVLKCISPSINVGEAGVSCKPSHTKLGSLIFRFARGGLCLTDAASCSKTWAQAMVCINKLVAEFGEDAKNFGGSTSMRDVPSIEPGGCPGCQHCARDLKDEIQALIFEEKREFWRRGSCLKCLKKGDIGYTALDGSCPVHGMLSELTRERIAYEFPLEESNSNTLYDLGQINPLGRQIFATLKYSIQDSDGLEGQIIADTIGASFDEVCDVAKELVARGLIFTTVDHHTWGAWNL